MIACLKAMARWRVLACWACVLPEVSFAQAGDDKLAVFLEQYKVALENKDSGEAVLACAGALRLAPANKEAQGCAVALKSPDQISSAASAGKVFLGAGEVEKALALCGAALVLNPTDSNAAGCAATARC